MQYKILKSFAANVNGLIKAYSEGESVELSSSMAKEWVGCGFMAPVHKETAEAPQVKKRETRG